MLRLPSFDYLQPKSLRQALLMRREAGPDAMYVAGGTDLFPNMKRRHQEPKTLIALSGIRALGRITGGARGAAISVGAGVTLTQLHEHTRIRKNFSALARAAELVSTPLLRNMGTFGGNLCLDTRCNYYNQTYEWRRAIDFCMKKDGTVCWVAPSSPRCWAVNSSDTAPVMVAMDASFVIAGLDGEREVAAGDFYRDDGIQYLAKDPAEILTQVRLPALNSWDATYWKLRRRGSFDFPVLGVATWIKWDNSFVAEARIVLGGMASYPKSVPEAAQAIIGSELEDDAIAAAAEAAFRPAKPMDNTDFGLAWRKEMVRNYVRGTLEELRDRRR
jgi:4-hydroxybenzoyl-CoA reductase subunit beta